MDKLDSIYTLFLKEQTERAEILLRNTDKAEYLHDILEAVTNPENFDDVEEILNEILAEAEETGFKNGIKFAFRKFAETLND